MVDFRDWMGAERRVTENPEPRFRSDDLCDVRFEVEGDAGILREEKSGTRGQRLLEQMRGQATSRMSTEEIMALTRPED
ncbi:MAG TPA: hypothetical protein VGR07_23850 [Thermoanaerobaculia bacterium]|jgi:hypothetical protein|nr:hypothetical protein [Thermoanaerobaculia bacterium]